MGVFNFLKKFSKKKEEMEKIKLDELNNWVESYSKKVIDDVNFKLGEIKEKISVEKKKSKENLNLLKDAKLKNKNIPKRVKQIRDGNRVTYIQKVNMLIEKVNLPENLDDIARYCDSFDSGLELFSKNTLRGYRVLQEFFGEEVRNVADNIRDIDKLVRDSKSILKVAKIEKISELKNKIKETEQKIIRKIEIKNNIQSRTNELKKLKEQIHKNTDEINKIESGVEYRKIIGLIDRKKVLKQNISELEKEVWHSFSVIEPALKKYERITLEKELAERYLTNSLKALFNDSELNVVKLLENMKMSIMENKIELKDKKRAKILNELNRLDLSYFKGLLRRYNDINDELNDLTSAIDISTLINKSEKIKNIVDDYNDKFKSTKTKIDDLTKEVKDIDIKELKKELEKDVFSKIGKNISIL